MRFPKKSITKQLLNKIVSQDPSFLRRQLPSKSAFQKLLSEKDHCMIIQHSKTVVWQADSFPKSLKSFPRKHLSENAVVREDRFLIGQLPKNATVREQRFKDNRFPRKFLPNTRTSQENRFLATSFRNRCFRCFRCFRCLRIQPPRRSISKFHVIRLIKTTTIRNVRKKESMIEVDLIRSHQNTSFFSRPP